jgi:hypothetical protein
MKLKVDFVTNSSSASFTIAKEDLTEEQLIMIYNHIEIGSVVLPGEETHYFGHFDEWLIWEKDGKIIGDTTMDNFPMSMFLREIGIPDEKVEYVHDG